MLIVLSFFCSRAAVAQPVLEKTRFLRIDVTHGLSNSNVTCIFQDSKGFLWVGTEDGLNKYDGYNFQVYRKIDDDTVSLLKNSITSLFEDSRGTLWVSTRGGGLHHYDPRLDRFERVPQFSFNCDVVSLTEDADRALWIAGTRLSQAFAARLDRATMQWHIFNLFDSTEPVVSLIQTAAHEFYLGVRRTGFFKWDRQQNRLKRYTAYPHDPHGPVSGDINRAVKDQQGNIWIATRIGLSRFDPETERFTNFTAQPDRPNTLPANAVRDLCVDGNYIWLAIENGGLCRMHTGDYRIANFQIDKNDPFSLSDNSVWSVYRDPQGRIWAGTFSRGLCVIDPMREKFSELNIPLENDIVNAIRQDSKGRIWIGTEGGLAVKDKSGVRYYRHDPALPGSLSSDPVLSIYEDSRQRLWFGTWAGGINLYDEQNDRFIHYMPDSANLQSLSNPNVYSIIEHTKTHQLLVASYRGLNVLTDESKGAFRHHIDPAHESNNYLRTLYEDSRGNLWTGSISELNLFDPVSTQRTRFNFTNDSISYDFFVNTILEDKRGRLWIGTNYGLYMMVDKELAASYSKDDGLPGNIVNGVLEDDNGTLWLSTTQGISQFDPENKTFRNYNINDGLLSNEFKPSACFKSRDGVFFFGGKGVNVFVPDSIRLNPFVPPVYITDFKIFNESLKIGDRDSMLRAHISETREIVLPQADNFFTIGFVALNFSSSSKNRYAYMLEGFDKDWVHIGSQRTATFTNLDAGTYTFRVKGSNNDGLWNEQGAALVIRVLPPWWKTTLFRAISALAVAGMAIGYYKARVRSMNRQNIRLEELVTERTRELQQANEELVLREEEITAQNDELYTQREMLEARNKSLEASKKQQLDLYTQNIVEKSEIIDRMGNELRSIKDQSSNGTIEVKKFSKMLHANIATDEDWEHFQKVFTEVYPDFLANLRYRFPDITAAELRLSALIKLKLSLKESANMLGISSESVKKSRYRLKKKIALQDEVTLEEFMNRLG